MDVNVHEVKKVSCGSIKKLNASNDGHVFYVRHITIKSATGTHEICLYSDNEENLGLNLARELKSKGTMAQQIVDDAEAEERKEAQNDKDMYF